MKASVCCIPLLLICGCGDHSAARSDGRPLIEQVESLAKMQTSEDELIKTVDSYSSPVSLTSADVIRLKQNGVSDKVVIAMLQRRR